MNDTNNNIPLLKKCLVAVRPFAYTASVTSVLLGLAIAWYEGYAVHSGLFALTLLGVLCFHTAGNLLNDCFDHQRGLDKEVLATSGAVVRGWLTEKHTYIAAISLLGIGIICGLILAYATGWVVLLLGLIGTVIALGYTRPGFCLKYAAFGDLAIFIAFGVLPVFGTYWVQAQRFSWVPILWSIPLSLLTVAILHANNWRDILSDPTQGCVTLASLFGDRGSARYYCILMLSPFFLVALYLLIGFISSLNTLAPVTVLLVMLALPLAFKLTRIRKEQDATLFSMLDAKTAQVQLLFGILLPITFVIARLWPMS